MIEERVHDSALVGLITKWLKAGILDASQFVIHPATGTAQGGIISSILANIYLHFALTCGLRKLLSPGVRAKLTYVGMLMTLYGPFDTKNMLKSSIEN